MEWLNRRAIIIVQRGRPCGLVGGWQYFTNVTLFLWRNKSGGNEKRQLKRSSDKTCLKVVWLNH